LIFFFVGSKCTLIFSYQEEMIKLNQTTISGKQLQKHNQEWNDTVEEDKNFKTLEASGLASQPAHSLP